MIKKKEIAKKKHKTQQESYSSDDRRLTFDALSSIAFKKPFCELSTKKSAT